MTTSPDGIAAELDAAIPGRVHPPGSAGFRESLSRIFFPDAARRNPPCVVHPRTVSDVATIAAAPTSVCRIDFQHTGGALADVDDAATSFWGRGAEGNVPLNAIWSDAADTDRCAAWARDTLDILAADSIGVYSVELRPGFTETERETEAAFGGNLARLRGLRDRIDPGRVLGVSPL